MKVRYINQQDEHDSMNRKVIAGSDELIELFNKRRACAPFIAELIADNDHKLTVGIGTHLSFAQHMRIDGELPYLVALPQQPSTDEKYVEFLINNTPSPIPARYVLSFDEMLQIAIHFLQTGQRSGAFSWMSI